MYLHQSNNLNNSINLNSNHNHTMSDTFHQQQTKTSNYNDLNDETHNENENYLENFNQLNKLTIDQFNYNQESNDLIKSTSCSPSFATNTLNNITNFNLNKQFIDKDELKTKINSNIISTKLNLVNDQIDNEQNEFSSMDPLTRYLELHPKYLELFDRFYNFLFNGDGSLPYHIRHYIAIMAAARHQCTYLVNDQKEQFKKVGGDLTWLNGIEYVPKKIQNLNEINKILAHQPWLLTKEHIERLTRGDDNWSLSELVQAIVIMAQFHTLSSFVFGCGFNDADLKCSTKLTPNSPNFNSNNISDLLLSQKYVSSAPPSPPSPNSNLNHLLNTNQNETTESNLLNLINSNLNQQQTNELDQTKTSKSTQDQQANYLEILMLKMQNISEQKQQQFELDNQEELVKNQSLEIHLTPTQTLANEFSFNVNGQKNSNSTSPNQLTSKCLGNADQYDLIKFIQDSKFCYADFARQRALTDICTFRVQDFGWSDHAYSLVNRLYSDVGNMLDEKFTTIYNLTYYTMGRKTNVDTSVFRQAIWNYIQCMYGIRHDDYDYHEINELLERPIKTYIKTVCCFPHQVRNKDCDYIMKEFRRSEKIHVNIMITEARLQAELLYALRTISKYMT